MLRRILLLLVIATAGVTAFFVFHHPPMRLMPPPLLFQDAGARVFELAPDLATGSEISLFYATSRLPVGPRDNRVYTVAPDRRLHLGTATLRIGEEGSTLDQLKEWTTRADTGDRPFLNLIRMDEAATVADPADPGPDAAAWLAEIDAALAASRSKDILIYVHGANTTVERAAGQAAQLQHFAGREAVVVLFAWPTAENFLRYSRDIENAFGSAPHLAALIALLARHTTAHHVGVFTYSAGATVGSDALARLARDDPAAAARLGEVYHAAPDADFRGFVDDLAAYGKDARRVTTAVNLGDSALRLAGAVNRASRAGRPDLPSSPPRPPPSSSPPPTTTASRSSRSTPRPCPTSPPPRTPSGTTTPGSATTCSSPSSSTSPPPPAPSSPPPPPPAPATGPSPPTIPPACPPSSTPRAPRPPPRHDSRRFPHRKSGERTPSAPPARCATHCCAGTVSPYFHRTCQINLTRQRHAPCFDPFPDHDEIHLHPPARPEWFPVERFGGTGVNA